MLNDKEKNLIMLLELPHRISNPRAMMQACEDAAAIIKRQDAEITALTESSQPKRARNSNGTIERKPLMKTRAQVRLGLMQSLAITKKALYLAVIGN